MTKFADLGSGELEQLIDRPWDSLYSHKASFANLLEPWVRSQHLHLPATRELLCRQRPVIPNHQTLDLSDIGHRYVDGYGTSIPPNDKAPNKALLMMFGYSTEQLALSIAFHYHVCGCRYFIPFCGNNLKKQRNDVAGLLGDVFRATRIDDPENIPPDTSVPKVVDDPSVVESTQLFLASVDPGAFFNEINQTANPSDVFRTLMNWLKNPPEPFHTNGWGFAVEVTGGQKTMDSGATAFASYYGLPAFYLDSEEYDPDLRRPHPKSTRCKLLLLPGASFSHRTREAVLQRFRSCDFAVARALTDEVVESMKRANSLVGDTLDGATPFFSDEDFRGLAQLQRQLDESRKFTDSAYAVPVVGRKSLANVLTEEGSRARSADVRSQVEGLLAYAECPTSASQEYDWRTFIDYVADEFYRLETILGIDVSMPSVSSQDTQRNYREVLLAGLGLAELLLEAMIRISGTAIKNLHSVERVEGRNRSQITHTDSPANVQVARLWHMDYQNKWDFLRKGSCKASFRSQDINGVPTFQKPGKRDSSYFEITAELGSSISAAFVVKLKTSKVWGAPYVDADWRDARNPITHMRAPLDNATKQIAVDAVKKYLPGLIELVYRMAKDRSPVDCADAADLSKWLTWNKEDSEWCRQRRVPWVGEEHQLRRWLSIELGAPELAEVHRQ